MGAWVLIILNALNREVEVDKMFSFFRRSKSEEDYETMLDRLNHEIQLHEENQTRIKMTSSRVISSYLFYAISLYIIIAGLYTLRSTSVIPLKALILAISSFVIYFIYLILNKWFERLQEKEVDKLIKLRRRQQTKVEELKKKNSYYITKELIERYETPTKTSIMKAGTPNPSSPVKLDNNCTTPSGTPLLIQNIATPVNNTPIPEKVNTPRTWIDKLLDKIIGEETKDEDKYALICESCFVHNGLVMKEEYPKRKFSCYSCGFITQKHSLDDSLKDISEDTNVQKKIEVAALKVSDMIDLETEKKE